MQILAVDIGTGTQDIFLYNPELDIENGFKLVLPSPTMIVHNKIRAATQRGAKILLHGCMMGGGPCQWAARDHVRAGYKVYATASAARTFNDDLEYVQREMGVQIVGDEEQPNNVEHIELKDFDLAALHTALIAFGVQLKPEAIGVAVFDHGDSPPNYSDRQFRFDYLDQRLREHNSLTAFAYLATQIPKSMTRLQAVASSYQGEAPLVVMDTAPAAVLGAMHDPITARQANNIFCNVGNFHTLAFRLESLKITGVFEHHTGEIDSAKLDSLLTRLIAGTLKHAEVFDDMGHGALLYVEEPLKTPAVVVTGPRRSLMRESIHQPYYAVPFGDMMIAGCFGLLAAMAEKLPDEKIRVAIAGSLKNRPTGKAPWDIS